MQFVNPVDKQPAALLPYPSKLFVETTTLCNLSCFMCVKQSQERSIKEGDITTETFAQILPALPHIKALILNGIGEPLLHPKLETFIREARKQMNPEGWIGFQTNGLLLDEYRAYSLLEAGLDRICLSIDATNPEMFKQVRAGGEVFYIDKALNHLLEAKLALGKKDFKVGIEFVVMRSNINELPDTIHWAASRGASFALVTHVLPYDQAHMKEAVYSLSSEKALQFYLKGKQQALSDGVDITEYPRVLWKFQKSESDRKIIDYVDKMKTAAEAQGVILDLKKLFALDLDWLTQVSKIFDKTRNVAEKHGIALHLPPISLKDDRKCEFVEEGSVFVSWNGDIHPCYFLWHTYRSFASGWLQNIKPKIFGSVKEQNILSIWNSREFREFRRSVLTYDYPYCSNCGLAPCDYVQTDNFEQDCHIKNEQCGSCLWCMGVFKCLS